MSRGMLWVLETMFQYGLLYWGTLTAFCLPLRRREDFRVRLALSLLPLLLLLCFCIGAFTSYLSTKGRVREFAVMRCLGMSPAKVFTIVFEEFIVLAICGGAAGFLCGYLAEGSVSIAAAACALGIVGVYLTGAAIAALRVCRVNVMKLMKGEKEA